MLARFLAAMLGTIVLAGAALAAVPPVRHGVTAIFNSPARLPALAGDPRVRFEPGAEPCAREVAQALPAAVKTVEARQNHGFARALIVGVYATDAAYSAANSMGAPGPAGVAARGVLALSPRLCGADHDRLQAIVTHELSHANLQQNLSMFAFFRLPKWFVEGLAVSVSGGGGAERVTPQEARAEIDAGQVIAIDDDGSIFNTTAVRFEKPTAQFDIRQAHLAYRQAGMFVDRLRSDAPAFEELLKRVYAGERFSTAFAASYGASPRDLWARFVAEAPR